jgi:putative transcriptional regulator
LIRHHPSEETLGLFALGGLRAGARLVIAAHLERCDRCRREVGRIETAAGSLMGAEEAAAMAPDALARALERLNERPPAAPEPFELTAAVRRGAWLPAGPGLWFKPLSRYAERSERLYLIKARAGTPLPRHGHNGCERLIVLEGAFKDEGGDYGPGDVAESDEETVHEPLALPGGACICLAVTEGPLRLSGVARWLQPILGV